MKTLIQVGLLTLALCGGGALAQEGIERLVSQHSVDDTEARLLAALDERGITLFSQIDHAANARSADLTLGETRVIQFGNPAVGTRLMHCQPAVALELPLKTLIHEGEDGTVWLSWQSPAYLAQRYALGASCDETVAQMTGLLEGMMAEVAGPGVEAE